VCQGGNHKEEQSEGGDWKLRNNGKEIFKTEVIPESNSREKAIVRWGLKISVLLLFRSLITFSRTAAV
jgi:hypothetical protein